MLFTELVSAVGALALVIGLILLLSYGTRFVASRRAPDGGAGLKVAGQLGLDGKRRLYLVQCGAGQVLLLTGGTADVMMTWPERPGHSV